MSHQHLNNYLKKSLNESIEINEFLLTVLAAGALLGIGFGPVFKDIYKKTKPILKWFSTDARRDRARAAHDKKREKREKEKRWEEDKARMEKEKAEWKREDENKRRAKLGLPPLQDKEDQDKTDSSVLAMSLLDEKAKQTKDEDEKKKLTSYKEMLSASTFDEKGNPIPAEEREEKLKQMLPEGTNMDDFKKNIEAGADQLDDPATQKLLKEKMSKMSVEDLEKAEKSTQDEAKKSWEKINNGEKIGENVLKDMEKDSKKDSKEEPKEEPKKDADGNIVKKETIKDPETGEEKKVATHTGPRGGKYYLSKNNEKVYIESLSEHLVKSMGQIF